MSYKSIIVEKKDGIGKIVFNKPDRMNPIGVDVLEDLEASIAELGRDENIKVIIITGGELPDKKRAFSVGADLANIGFGVKHPNEIFEIVRKGQKITSLIENLDKFTIALVNGFCLGGGLEIAMACDYIIASEDAELGQPEINLGIIPGWGGTQRLPRRIGMPKALEMILTGERIKAEEAAKFGLVDKIVPREKLEEAANTLANKIISKSPIIIRIAKQATRRAMNT
ncbi:MAG: enoyl-CoA hydratase/isomerase family protein, partial [Candidatus Bathyarchaeia archaeon]